MGERKRGYDGVYARVLRSGKLLEVQARRQVPNFDIPSFSEYMSVSSSDQGSVDRWPTPAPSPSVSFVANDTSNSPKKQSPLTASGVTTTGTGTHASPSKSFHDRSSKSASPLIVRDNNTDETSFKENYPRRSPRLKKNRDISSANDSASVISPVNSPSKHFGKSPKRTPLVQRESNNKPAEVSTDQSPRRRERSLAKDKTPLVSDTDYQTPLVQRSTDENINATDVSIKQTQSPQRRSITRSFSARNNKTPLATRAGSPSLRISGKTPVKPSPLVRRNDSITVADCTLSQDAERSKLSDKENEPPTSGEHKSDSPTITERFVPSTRPSHTRVSEVKHHDMASQYSPFELSGQIMVDEETEVSNRFRNQKMVDKETEMTNSFLNKSKASATSNATIPVFIPPSVENGSISTATHTAAVNIHSQSLVEPLKTTGSEIVEKLATIANRTFSVAPTDIHVVETVKTLDCCAASQTFNVELPKTIEPVKALVDSTEPDKTFLVEPRNKQLTENRNYHVEDIVVSDADEANPTPWAPALQQPVLTSSRVGDATSSSAETTSSTGFVEPAQTKSAVDPSTGISTDGPSNVSLNRTVIKSNPGSSTGTQCEPKASAELHSVSLPDSATTLVEHDPQDNHVDEQNDILAVGCLEPAISTHLSKSLPCHLHQLPPRTVAEGTQVTPHGVTMEDVTTSSPTSTTVSVSDKTLVNATATSSLSNSVQLSTSLPAEHDTAVPEAPQRSELIEEATPTYMRYGKFNVPTPQPTPAATGASVVAVNQPSNSHGESIPSVQDQSKNPNFTCDVERLPSLRMARRRSTNSRHPDYCVPVVLTRSRLAARNESLRQSEEASIAHTSQHEASTCPESTSSVTQTAVEANKASESFEQPDEPNRSAWTPGLKQPVLTSSRVGDATLTGDGAATASFTEPTRNKPLSVSFAADPVTEMISPPSTFVNQTGVVANSNDNSKGAQPEPQQNSAASGTGNGTILVHDSTYPEVSTETVDESANTDGFCPTTARPLASSSAQKHTCMSTSLPCHLHHQRPLTTVTQGVQVTPSGLISPVGEISTSQGPASPASQTNACVNTSVVVIEKNHETGFSAVGSIQNSLHKDTPPVQAEPHYKELSKGTTPAYMRYKLFHVPTPELTPTGPPDPAIVDQSVHTTRIAEADKRRLSMTPLPPPRNLRTTRSRQQTILARPITPVISTKQTDETANIDKDFNCETTSSLETVKPTEASGPIQTRTTEQSLHCSKHFTVPPSALSPLVRETIVLGNSPTPKVPERTTVPKPMPRNQIQCTCTCSCAQHSKLQQQQDHMAQENAPKGFDGDKTALVEPSVTTMRLSADASSQQPSFPNSANDELDTHFLPDGSGSVHTPSSSLHEETIVPAPPPRHRDAAVGTTPHIRRMRFEVPTPQPTPPDPVRVAVGPVSKEKSSVQLEPPVNRVTSLSPPPAPGQAQPSIVSIHHNDDERRGQEIQSAEQRQAPPIVLNAEVHAERSTTQQPSAESTCIQQPEPLANRQMPAATSSPLPSSLDLKSRPGSKRLRGTPELTRLASPSTCRSSTGTSSTKSKHGLDRMFMLDNSRLRNLPHSSFESPNDYSEKKRRSKRLRMSPKTCLQEYIYVRDPVSGLMTKCGKRIRPTVLVNIDQYKDALGEIRGDFAARRRSKRPSRPTTIKARKQAEARRIVDDLLSSQATIGSIREQPSRRAQSTSSRVVLPNLSPITGPPSRASLSSHYSIANRPTPDDSVFKAPSLPSRTKRSTGSTQRKSKSGSASKATDEAPDSKKRRLEDPPTTKKDAPKATKKRRNKRTEAERLLDYTSSTFSDLNDMCETLHEELVTVSKPPNSRPAQAQSHRSVRKIKQELDQPEAAVPKRQSLRPEQGSIQALRQMNRARSPASQQHSTANTLTTADSLFNTFSSTATSTRLSNTPTGFATISEDIPENVRGLIRLPSQKQFKNGAGQPAQPSDPFTYCFLFSGQNGRNKSGEIRIAPNGKKSGCQLKKDVHMYLAVTAGTLSLKAMLNGQTKEYEILAPNTAHMLPGTNYTLSNRQSSECRIEYKSRMRETTAV